MKKFRELSGQIKEKDEREYDYEGDMAKTQLKTIIRNAETIHDMLEDDENLPEWVQSKITLAKDYIVVAANYLQSEMDESSSAYDRINARFKKLSGRSMGDAAKEHGEEAKRLQKEIDAQKAENERRKAAMKTEEVELDEAIPKSTHYATLHSSSRKIVAKGNKKDMLKKMKELNKKEKGSHHLGVTHKGKVGDIFGEEVELDEGRPSQHHPLEGHEYHKKSNDALVHIAKDAHKAAEAMKGHNTNAENKYRDQANDSATVRHFRKTSGMPDWYKKKYGHMKEEIETLEEKNKPTNPELWSRAIALAKSKFDVYPSAYANGWASKWYKSKGGGWRTVSEAKEDNLPFTPDKEKKKSVVVGKKPEGYSIARQLARQSMQKQIEKLKKPVKESEEKATEPFSNSSRKSKIIKDVVKNKKMNDSFHSEPIVATPVDSKQT